MILTILGGGGFRVPLVYRALLADSLLSGSLISDWGERAKNRITQVRLYDLATSRLRAISAVLAELAADSPDAPRVSIHTDLIEALDGADFVFSAIRVGGLAGRELDETIPAAHSLIGQETVGAGGIAYGLRTLPVVKNIAETVKRVAPKAWLINFTNPAGLVTEALIPILGHRVVGICDSPIGLGRRAFRALGIDSSPTPSPDSGIEIDYVGLNHLGWVRRLLVDGVDQLPKLLADPILIESFEEGRLFGAQLIQSLGALPNEYLHYYYFTRDALKAAQAEEQTRAQQIQHQQRAFYQISDVRAPGALKRWDDCRLAREETYMQANREAAGSFERDAVDLAGGGYEQVALAVMQALANDRPTVLILNQANQGRLSSLDPDAVIEAPCLVDGTGIHPLPIPELPDYALGLVNQVKFVERCTLKAAETGSKRDAWKAFSSHPLVDSASVAKLVLDDFLAADPGLQYLK